MGRCRANGVTPLWRLSTQVQAAGGKSAQTRGSRRRMPAPPRAEGRVEAEVRAQGAVAARWRRTH